MVFALSIVPSTANAAVSDLELYYDFNDGTGSAADDGSANNRDGTLTNMDNADWVTGRTGQTGDYALDFDGGNDYVVASGYKGVAGSGAHDSRLDQDGGY